MNGLLVLASWAFLAAATGDPSVGRNPEHFTVVGTDQYRISAYPTVASLSDGRLLCVFSAIDARTGDKAVIAGSFSRDQGRSWSNPTVLIDSRPDLDYDPAIVVIGTRVIVSSTTVPPTHGQFISTSRTVAVRSEDDGQTWSARYASCYRMAPLSLATHGTQLWRNRNNSSRAKGSRSVTRRS